MSKISPTRIGNESSQLFKRDLAIINLAIVRYVCNSLTWKLTQNFLEEVCSIFMHEGMLWM